MGSKQPRTPLSVRLGAPTVKWLDELADKYQADRSEVVRAALQVAKQHPEELNRQIEQTT